MSEATTASGADSSTTSTILTPPESVFTGSANEHEGGSSSAPWPGATYIIQSREYGQVITLVDGQPILAPLGSGERGSMYWKCIDHQGWLGFKNSASGGLLGYGSDRIMVGCTAQKHQEWGALVCETTTGRRLCLAHDTSIGCVD